MLRWFESIAYYFVPFSCFAQTTPYLVPIPQKKGCTPSDNLRNFWWIELFSFKFAKQFLPYELTPWKQHSPTSAVFMCFFVPKPLVVIRKGAVIWSRSNEPPLNLSPQLQLWHDFDACLSLFCLGRVLGNNSLLIRAGSGQIHFFWSYASPHPR